MVKVFFQYCSPYFHFIYFSLSFSPHFLSFFLFVFFFSSFHIFFSFSSSLLFGHCNLLREEEDNILRLCIKQGYGGCLDV